VLPLPRLWLVRAELRGADEAFNFRESVTSIHWNDAPNPRLHSKKELAAFFAAHTESGGPHAAGQIENFYDKMQIGDYVVTPLWNHGHKYVRVAVGVVTGEYVYLDHDPEPAPRQTRTVNWIATNVERESLRPKTQTRLLNRHTCQPIHDERVILDILAHAGAYEGHV
jgi:predicted Mrr-cat superfamily restriction endonuclease